MMIDLSKDFELVLIFHFPGSVPELAGERSYSQISGKRERQFPPLKRLQEQIGMAAKTMKCQPEERNKREQQ